MIFELGRASGKGNAYSHQYSCLENPMNKGAWQAIVEKTGNKELDMTEHICTHVHILNNFLPTEAKSVCTGLMTQKPIPGGIAKSDC